MRGILSSSIFALSTTLLFGAYIFSSAESTPPSLTATSSAPAISRHVFIANVSEHVTRSTTTPRVLDVHWYIPSATGTLKFVSLFGDDGVALASSTVSTATTSPRSLEGVISAPAPTFGDYVYTVKVCESMKATSSPCYASVPFHLIFTEKSVSSIEDVDPESLTQAEFEAAGDYVRGEQLAWVRALLPVARIATGTCPSSSDCVSTTTYAGVERKLSRYIPPEKFFWRKDSAGESECILDVIETKFSLMDSFAKSRCKGVGTTTSSVLEDSEIIAAQSAMHRRAVRIEGAGKYEEGSPSFDGPLVVGTYDSERSYEAETQPSRLPVKRLHVIQYGRAIASSSGELMIEDPYVSTDQYFGGECMSLGCAHGMFTELARMKKANEKLRVQMRIDVDHELVASSSLVDVFVSSAKDFLKKNDVFDGFDVTVHGKFQSHELARILSPLHDMRPNSTSSITTLTLDCSSASCFDLIKEVEPFVDLVFVSSHVTTATGAHYLSPMSGLLSGVNDLLKRGFLPSKIAIDIPLRSVLWSDDGVHDLDVRTVRARYLGKGDFERHFDEKEAAATLVSSSTGLISYEDEEAIAQKTLFTLRSGLGGIRLRDTAADDGTLALKVSRVFGDADKGAACAISMIPPRNLAGNSRGKDVRALQDFLQCRNFIPGYTQLDGSYGPITAAAVKLYQMSEGLEPVGTVGSSTRASLSKYLEQGG